MSASFDQRPGNKPLLRWAGGKRWLAPAMLAIQELVEPSSYLEPFAGGAAVFFAASWPRPIIGDVNTALMQCYKGLAQDPHRVRLHLQSYSVDAESYARIGASRPEALPEQAARLLYLNKTAYGGIYRENKAGLFNVPYSGDRSLAPLLRDGVLEAAGRSLRRAQLINADFRAVLARARGRSLIYCDPPYSLEGAEAGFRRYTHVPFSWRDQKRLAAKLHKLSESGNTVVLSNAADDAVRAIYPRAQVVLVLRRSPLSRAGHVEQKEAIYVLHKDDGLSTAVASAIAAHV